MSNKSLIRKYLREHVSENCENNENFESIDKFLDNLFEDATIEYVENYTKFYVNEELVMIKYPNRAIIDSKIKDRIDPMFFFDSEYDLRCIVKKWIMRNYPVKSKGQHFGVNFNGSYQ